MSKFHLTSGANTYALDTDGTFTLNAGQSGKWTVHDSGDILLQSDGAADMRVPVEWRFNGSNQLFVKQGANTVFNFHTTGLRPMLRLISNVLQVRPSAALSFEFTVPFAWSLEANCNLTARLGAASSTLDGYIDDKKGRMIFLFSDKQNLVSQYALMFNGEWSRSADPVKAGDIHLVFAYQQNGATATFILPTGADVKDNHLVFSYQKNGTSRSVQLLGSVKVSDNLDVSFTIAQQTNSAGGVVTKETTITVSTAFTWTNLSGGLDLTLVNSNKQISITGSFNATIGAGGKLQIDFNYAKENGATGQSQKLTLAVEGSFTTADGATFTFSYKRSPGNAAVMTVTGSGQLGAVGVTGGIQVTLPNGTHRTVAAFLQLSW